MQQTNSMQISLVIPTQLGMILKNESQKKGLSVTDYVSNLITNSVKNKVPSYRISKKALANLKAAQTEVNNDTIKDITDVKNFLQNL